MNDISKSIVAMKDEVVGFLKLERVLAFICIFIPLILILFDCNKVRGSISEYADMEQNQVFVFLLTMASMMFLVNGVVKEEKWYNSILGISLMGVTLFHYVDYRITHIVFAAIFFLGSAIVISYYTSKKQKLVASILAIIIVFALLAHFKFHWISLFVAEWIALGIIGIHYILESFKILD